VTPRADAADEVRQVAAALHEHLSPGPATAG
jgi:hypothetical protein